MSMPKSLLSYSDCIDYFDTALAHTEGARIPVEDINDATNLRLRLNNCRKLHREANAKMYPEHHIMHGRSQYDKLVVKIKAFGEEDKLFVVLERTDISRRNVEGIGAYIEDEGMVPIEQEKPLMLSAPTESEMENLEVIEDDKVEVLAPKGLRRI